MTDGPISVRSGVGERDWRIFQTCNETGEPCIVFRAQDAGLPDILDVVRRIYNDMGCEQDILDAIDERRESVMDWQHEYSDKVKAPDIRPDEGLEP